MKSDTGISIIIPVYNRAKVVGRTLASVAAQTYRPINLILVDNNSTDESLAVLQKWATDNIDNDFNITLLQELKPGATAARNCGLSAATTPYVMFFDSDDTMSPRLVESIMKCFTSDTALDLVGWDISQQLPSGRTRTGYFRTRNPLYNHIIHGTLSTQRYACRKELAVNAGGWDESVRGWNDYELGMRILLQHPCMRKLGLRHPVQAYFTEESITGRSYAADPAKWEHSLDLCESALRNADRHKAVKWIDVRRMILAASYAAEGAAAESRRLKNSVINRYSGFNKLVFRLIYLKARIYRRGTHIIAGLFFSKNI